MDLSRYKQPHIDVFTSIGYEPQGVFGRSPAAWGKTMGFDNVPDQENLPDQQLTRHEVRSICQNSKIHPLFAYVCAMAWGMQGTGVTIRYARSIWQNHSEQLHERLKVLQSAKLSRKEAYALFIGDNKITGLGPAYFTKLLYFFGKGDDFYIMDQWTGKSINLLLGSEVVKMAGNAVSPQNTPENYERYCTEIDKLAQLLSMKGYQVEEMLFSEGGRHPRFWRNYVVQAYKDRSSLY